MFTDEPAAQQHGPVGEPDGSRDVPESKQPMTGGARSLGIDPSLAKEADEESIEQYMAKLLQRVRGGSLSAATTSGQPTGAPLNTRAETIPGRGPVQAATPGEVVEPNSTEIQQRATSEAPKRRASAPAPATDLGALRALANETARRAISRSELRKHRRSAVTKVIVSTLAGVTSLWMMLQSPDWRDIQFITACVSLLVAAYWAGETFRTLLGSLRAAAYDGPEAGLDEDDALGAPALPIDVEARE